MIIAKENIVSSLHIFFIEIYHKYFLTAITKMNINFFEKEI